MTKAAFFKALLFGLPVVAAVVVGYFTIFHTGKKGEEPLPPPAADTGAVATPPASATASVAPPATTAAASPASPPPAAATTAAEGMVAPTLPDDAPKRISTDSVTDGLKRELIDAATRLTALPYANRLLATTDPFQCAVQTLDAIARGDIPRAALAHLVSGTPYTSVQTDGGARIAAPATIARYQDAVDFFCAIPPADAAQWYRRAEPALQLAYEQMGYRGAEDVRDLVARACQMLLATPVPATPPTLLGPDETGLYRYADSALEALAPVQKLFLRLGVENCRRLQRQCRAIAAELSLNLPTDKENTP